MSKEPRKRQRSSLACEECRVKKARCSGHLGPTPCIRCQKRNIECRFDEKVPRRGPDPKKRKTLNIQQDGGDNISPSNSDRKFYENESPLYSSCGQIMTSSYHPNSW
ncbi:7100_t:CDS:2 [Cetraspora pellucida]|uniref:7100_t:CDS:1 n=1 Tax=Cetraspora pellucida TaxID=1433469 RepID=A0A9N8WI24_9GLOM|nr:7100_t:CDS:2 [Cetraspora pellucida]